jgi:transposase
MTPDEKYAYARSFPVHVGVDTGKTFHVMVARGPDGRRTKAERVAVSKAGFEGADAALGALFPDVPRAQRLVGLEFAGHHGFTFAHFLAQRGYPVVAVLPAVTKRTKEIEDNSPLKTDAKDAALIAKLVGDGSFVRFALLDEPAVELRLLATERHRLAVEEVRFKNRLQGLLDLAWPEYMGHFSDLTHPTPVGLLERWPLPQDLREAFPPLIRRVAKTLSRNHYGREKVEQLLQSAVDTVGLTTGAEARRKEIQRLLTRWALVRQQIVDVEIALSARVERSAAARALATVPEVGAVCAATLVAELGTPEDYESPRQVLKLAGMNLIEKSSGLSRGRPRQSKRGRPELRRQLYLLAGRWVKKRGGRYRAQYDALLQRNGGRKTKALCAIARKLVPMLLHVAKTHEPFDPARWDAERQPTAVRTSGHAPGRTSDSPTAQEVAMATA